MSCQACCFVNMGHAPSQKSGRPRQPTSATAQKDVRFVFITPAKGPSGEEYEGIRFKVLTPLECRTDMCARVTYRSYPSQALHLSHQVIPSLSYLYILSVLRQNIYFCQQFCPISTVLPACCVWWSVWLSVIWGGNWAARNGMVISISPSLKAWWGSLAAS